MSAGDEGCTSDARAALCAEFGMKPEDHIVAALRVARARQIFRLSLLRARREAVSELVEDGENSPISVGVNTAQAVAGSVWGKDAVEAFLFIDDPLDSPQLFELCSDLPHVFGGNKVRPDDTELSWWRFRHPAILQPDSTEAESSKTLAGG